MIATQEDLLRDALGQYFGFESFKGRQEEIVQAVIDRKDVVVIMPTGGGKSLCYQLPALLSEGTTLVISPLIALMKNQVDLLRGYSSDDDIAHFYNSSLTKTEKNHVLESVSTGKTKILYIAPETLTKAETLDFLRNIHVSFVAVDEAHCISEWGHDFRPEYRRIREMITSIGEDIPIIALTATATPKVQSDIIKTLKLEAPTIFQDSFNRKNLYYEIRPKKNDNAVLKDIVGFIKQREGKSGIIYVINRKTTEKVAEILSINGIKAAPYHAGLDGKKRTETQDAFLMEQIDVVVATIAFGMGIDKPDIRYVIHYDLPKSIENYYQETGRAGRDGMGGDCVCYYNYKDLAKLEHLLKDKALAERQRGMQLIDETVSYIESAICRRKFILHYFGEDYKESHCAQCDNCKNPKEKIDATNDLQVVIQAITDLHEKFDVKYMVTFLLGKESTEVKEYRHQELDRFGALKDKDVSYLNGLIRQAMIAGYIAKEVEKFGILHITEKGRLFLSSPTHFEFSKNHEYRTDATDVTTTTGGKGGALDDTLLKLLKDLRKTVATKHSLPPYVIFQDASLEDMATQYPITVEEFSRLQGVSKGKAERYGKEFAQLIQEYVEDNDIDRPDDFVVKTVAKKSVGKVKIIQSIDQRLPISDIARNLGKNQQEVINEIETIVNAGTKLDISYIINDIMDQELAEDVQEYFREAESDSLDAAYEEFEDENLELEDLQLVRIQFMSEMAN